MHLRGIHLSGLGRVARPVNHNLSRLWPLVGTTSCARSAQMNTPDTGDPDRRRPPQRRADRPVRTHPTPTTLATPRLRNRSPRANHRSVLQSHEREGSMLIRPMPGSDRDNLLKNIEYVHTQVGNVRSEPSAFRCTPWCRRGLGGQPWPAHGAWIRPERLRGTQHGRNRYRRFGRSGCPCRTARPHYRGARRRSVP
jgi:hypothetical protein